MNYAICTTCNERKPLNANFFYFRKDTNNFRRNCIKCANDRTRRTRKPGKIWTYLDAYNLFTKNDLTPLFKPSDERVKVKKKLPAKNREGYRVLICIDKLKSGKTPDSFSRFNPFTIDNIKLYIKRERQGMKLLSKEYRNNATKLKFECEKGHSFDMCWGDFKSDKGCAKCSKKHKRTHEEFIKEANELTDEYEFLDTFKSVDLKMNVIHKTCGHVYTVTPYKFLFREQRCPRCRESKGERKIRTFLIDNNIEFSEEYSFDDCVYLDRLRFDFAIFKKGNLVKLIEYDGRQHFQPEEFYGGKEKFELRIKRDKIKNDYCEKHNIELLRIPYTKYKDIPKILAAHL